MKSRLGTLLATTVLGTLLYVVLAGLTVALPPRPYEVRLYFNHQAWGGHTYPFPNLEWSPIFYPARDAVALLGERPEVLSYELSSNTSLFSDEFQRVAVIPDGALLSEEALLFAEYELLRYRVEGSHSRRFPVKGVSRATPFDLEFGRITLVDGRTLSEAEIREGAPVALVPVDFARLNSLVVGSVMELTTHQQAAQSLEVIGTFTPNDVVDYDEFYGQMEFEVSGEFLRQSAHVNRLYVPVALARSFWVPFDPFAWEIQAGYSLLHRSVPGLYPMLEMSFWLASPEDREAFYEAVSDILPPYWFVDNPSAPILDIGRAALERYVELLQFSLMLVVALLFLVVLLFRGGFAFKVGGASLGYLLGRLLAPWVNGWVFRQLLEQERSVYWETFTWLVPSSVSFDPMPRIWELFANWRVVLVGEFGLWIGILLVVPVLVGLPKFMKTTQKG